MLRLVSCVFLLCLPLSVYGQTYSLRQAVRVGIKNHPAYLEAVADSDAARSAAAEAASKKLPRIDLTETFLWTNEPGSALFIWLNQERLELSQTADIYNDPPDRHDFATRLQLTQPLYDPDISFGSRRAEVQAEAAKEQEKASREQVAWRIFSAYLNVQRSRAVIDWVDSSVREATEIHRLASEKEAAGTGLKADTLTASVRLAESRRLKISAVNTLQLARAHLAMAMGITGQPVDITAPLDVSLIPSPDEAQALQRHDLFALERQHQAAVLAREQSHAEWYPRLHAGASWTTHDRDYPFSDTADSWMVQVQLSWQLFDGFSRRHASAKALAEERSAAARTRQAYAEADLAVEQARLNSETARLQLAASEQGYAAAEESYQLLASRYRNGLTPLAELLTAQARMERSRADLADARVKLIHSLAQRHYVRGTFVTAVLGEEGSEQ